MVSLALLDTDVLHFCVVLVVSITDKLELPIL